jgi:polar amino acid transport system permease protein
MSEIVRAGILSVDPGQNEAARSIGLTSGQITRRIVLPQALRVIVPPTSNEFIAMLKYSSLAFVVSYSELLSQAAKLYTKNLQVIEVLLSVTIWYLVLTTVFSIVQYLIERRLLHEQAPARLISRLRGNFTWGRA